MEEEFTKKFVKRIDSESEFVVAFPKDVIDFIRNLLNQREREKDNEVMRILQQIVDDSCDGNSCDYDLIAVGVLNFLDKKDWSTEEVRKAHYDNIVVKPKK